MNPGYHKTKTLPCAIVRCKQVNAEWRSKVLDYVRPLKVKLGLADRRALQGLLGLRAYGGPILASDLSARRKFGLV